MPRMIGGFAFLYVFLCKGLCCIEDTTRTLEDYSALTSALLSGDTWQYLLPSYEVWSTWTLPFRGTGLCLYVVYECM